MNKLFKMMTMAGMAAALAACNSPKEEDFKYTIDTFADLKVMRYRIPGWEDLSLQQKEYAYHLAEAAKWGRDILWDQNCKDNLRVRHALEAVIQADGIDKEAPEYQDFLVYAKRVFFSNGIHHHYAEDKIFPACSQEYFATLLPCPPGRSVPSIRQGPQRTSIAYPVKFLRSLAPAVQTL